MRFYDNNVPNRVINYRIWSPTREPPHQKQTRFEWASFGQAERRTGKRIRLIRVLSTAIVSSIPTNSQQTLNKDVAANNSTRHLIWLLLSTNNHVSNC